ncbi:MAG: hypothetical protein FRX49_09528 [Trebouxia sp. A1-2]|nr:MAG: hypothetical protein FRX49_09528 [Trebouxia sp. A1-2]
MALDDAQSRLHMRSRAASKAAAKPVVPGQQNDTAVAHKHLPKSSLNHKSRTVNLPSIQDSLWEQT